MKDFIGKVKNKAGDVEKILKDKDKHGNSDVFRNLVKVACCRTTYSFKEKGKK